MTNPDCGPDVNALIDIFGSRKPNTIGVLPDFIHIMGNFIKVGDGGLPVVSVRKPWKKRDRVINALKFRNGLKKYIMYACFVSFFDSQPEFHGHSGFLMSWGRLGCSVRRLFVLFLVVGVRPLAFVVTRWN